MGNASYSDTNATFKLNINEIAKDGQVIIREAEQFIKMALYHGLKPTDLGRTFSNQGKTFEITGLNTRAHRYPIQATEIASGKTFKFPVDRVVAGLSQVAAG